MYNSIDEIMEANKDAGEYFFSEGAMNFFNSKIEGGVFHGRYFITSERFDDNSPRLYTIRRANRDGSVDTVGEFQKYSYFEEAYYAVKALKKK